MSIFNNIAGGMSKPQNQQINMAQARQQLQQNPVKILKQAGLSIPEGVTDPQQMVMHLFRSGQLGRNGLRIR